MVKTYLIAISAAVMLVFSAGCFCTPSGEAPQGPILNPDAGKKTFQRTEMLDYWQAVLPAVLMDNMGVAKTLKLEVIEGDVAELNKVTREVLPRCGISVSEKSAYTLSSRSTGNVWQMTLYKDGKQVWTDTLKTAEQELAK